MKDVVFWVGVKSKDPLLQKKHGGFKYLDISKKSWEYWCEKNNVGFVEYSGSMMENHKATWTRWFDVFPYLEKLKVSFDKILVVDGSTIVKWDAPNFFDQCPNGKLTAFRSLENLGWMHKSIQGYKDFFQGYDFDPSKYIDCGFQVFDISHKNFLENLKKFYIENYDKIMELQSSVNKGTDQPVYNYLLQINSVEVNFDLDPRYNLNHIFRFEWFKHNWQLKKDNIPFYQKYGYIWKFSGFDRSQRFDIMSEIWQSIKNYYE